MITDHAIGLAWLGDPLPIHTLTAIARKHVKQRTHQSSVENRADSNIVRHRLALDGTAWIYVALACQSLPLWDV